MPISFLLKLHYNKKNKLERICPLWFEDVGNKIHYLTDYKNEKMKKVQSEVLKTFYKAWKGADNLTKKEFCKALLSCQNDDVIYDVGTLCLKY